MDKSIAMFSFSMKRQRSAKKSIFLSYRRRDTESITKHLALELERHFGIGQVFLDMDALEPGADFEAAINQRLAACDVMLAIIGPDWTGQHADGSLRIADPHDWVHIELATALQRKIRVIPVLVEGATLPVEAQLPNNLKPLARRQAYELSNQRWKHDVEKLVAFLKKPEAARPKVTMVKVQE